MTEKQGKRAIDWESVEIHYRAGARSLKDIGAEYGVSDAGIIKKARKEGWVRDLKAKINAKADAKVSAAEVSGELVSLTKKAAESEIIEAVATKQADIRLNQRKDIAKARAIAMTLLDELGAENTVLPDLIALGEVMRSPDDRGNDKLNDLYLKIISMPGRVDAMKKLSETLKHLIGLEREAYGITSEPEKPEGLKAVMVSAADMRL